MRGWMHVFGARVLGGVLGLAVLVAGVRADEAVTLRYKWAKGEVQHMRMTMEMSGESKTSFGPMATAQKQVIDSTMTAQSVDADGTATLELVYDRVRMDTDLNGKKSSFDSSAAAAEGEEGPGKMLSKLVGLKLTMVMTSTGEVKDVRGMERVFDESGPSGVQLKQMFGPEAMKKMTQNSAYLPKDPVKRGDTWKRTSTVEAPMLGKLDYATENTFKGMEEKDGVSTARIGMTITMSSRAAEDGKNAPNMPPGMSMKMKDGKGDGDIWFDATKGRLVKMVMRQTTVMDMTMSMGAKTETMSQTGKTVMTMEMVEEGKGKEEKGK